MSEIPDVLSRLPHRAPFVLVDRVTVSEPGSRAEGYKLVAHNEPYLQGHFPGHPVLPGVLQIEAMAQLAAFAIEADASDPGGSGLVMLAGVDGARFRRAVVPGDRLDLRVEVVTKRERLWKVKGRGEVAGQRACEAEILLVRAPAPDVKAGAQTS